jgi:hypothetical protein
VRRVGDEVQHQNRSLGIVVAPVRTDGAEYRRTGVSGNPIVQGGLDCEWAVGADLSAWGLLEEKVPARAAKHPKIAVPARDFLNLESVANQRGEVEEAEAEEVGDARLQGQLNARPGGSQSIVPAALRVYHR